MKYIKKSQKTKPKVSLVLLDWSVRESFHLLDYLEKQTVSNEMFEVVFIEYYSRESSKLKSHADMVDTWMLLEMPTTNYYHKHLMYNAGILKAKGEIIVICDSDMMVKPSFIESIIQTFEKNENIFLHIDQFRSEAKEYYPFNYPSFEDVTSNQCKNYANGVTTGLAATADTIHLRNYGACFCALRKDLIDIGGADEHIDYVGHICGPYDMSFRLIVAGKKELWHDLEFVYHTWHPGSDGIANYLGPHDGKNISSTSLMVFSTKQVQPHVINKAIEKLRANTGNTHTLDKKDLFNPLFQTILDHKFLLNGPTQEIARKTYQSFTHNGLIIKKNLTGGYEAFSKLGEPIFSFKKLEHLNSSQNKAIKTHLPTKLFFIYLNKKEMLVRFFNLSKIPLRPIKSLIAGNFRHVLTKIKKTHPYMLRQKKRSTYLKRRHQELKNTVTTLNLNSIDKDKKILFYHQDKFFLRLLNHIAMKNNRFAHYQRVLSIKDFDNKDQFDHIIIDEHLFLNYYETLKEKVAENRITVI